MLTKIDGNTTAASESLYPRLQTRFTPLANAMIPKIKPIMHKIPVNCKNLITNIVMVKLSYKKKAHKVVTIKPTKIEKLHKKAIFDKIFNLFSFGSLL